MSETRIEAAPVEGLHLPHEPEAERALLGAVMAQPATLDQVLDKVSPEDFYLRSHQIIFSAMIGLQERGRAVDLVTLTDHLREEGALAKVGGAGYLASLADQLPDVAHAEHYARIVRDKAIKRRLMQAAQAILATCSRDEGAAQDVVEVAQRDIFRIAEEALTGGLVPVGELARKELEAMERARETHAAVTGLSTGFVDLDQLTSGLQRKDLILLAARPSMGKTALGLNICTNAALRHGAKVAVFSLEMAADQIVRRILSAEARVPQNRIVSGYYSKQEMLRLTLVAEQLRDARLWVDDTPGITVLELTAKARRLKQEHGLDLVMVDYLQLMSPGERSRSLHEEVSAISRGLKAAAKELDVPLLALSQLSRQPERRGEDHRPRLSDLRESGSLEQDADVVMFIVRPGIYDRENADPRQAQLIVAKQRNGPIGEIPLIFHNEYTRFDNADLSREEEESGPAPF